MKGGRCGGENEKKRGKKWSFFGFSYFPSISFSFFYYFFDFFFCCRNSF